MSRERVTLFDTTLRNGAQTTGVDFSLDDKKQIAGLLDALGVDYIEGGYPAPIRSTPNFFQKPTKKARFAAFGMTRRTGRSAANDPGIAALLDSAADAIVFVAKSWDFQVRVALGCTLEENLEGVTDSVKAAVAAGREVILDCEHFFDGYKDDPDYALACAGAGYEAGARWIVLCDTNGGTRRTRSRIVRAVSVHVPATISPSTPITTPNRRWPIRLPPCAPGRGRFTARSTGSASVAATPICARSSRRCC